MDAIVSERIVILAEAVNDSGRNARRNYTLDVRFDEFAKHSARFLSDHAELKRLGRLKVEENGGKDDRHEHPKLLLREDAARVLGSLKRKCEHGGGEMDMGKITDTEDMISLGWNE